MFSTYQKNQKFLADKRSRRASAKGTDKRKEPNLLIKDGIQFTQQVSQLPITETFSVFFGNKS